MDLAPEIVGRAQRGDRTATVLMLRALAGPIRGLLRRFARQDELEDRLQDVHAAVLTALPRFRPEGPARFSTWAFTVAHRQLLMDARKRRPELVAIEDVELVDPAASPEVATHHNELERLLDAALRELPEPQRRAFVLTQLHHQPLEAVAEVEGVPVGTIKSRVHRARAELVLKLGPALDQRGGPHAASR